MPLVRGLCGLYRLQFFHNVGTALISQSGWMLFGLPSTIHFPERIDVIRMLLGTPDIISISVRIYYGERVRLNLIRLSHTLIQ
jgi:hypothetical protein